MFLNRPNSYEIHIANEIEENCITIYKQTDFNTVNVNDKIMRLGINMYCYFIIIKKTLLVNQN